MDLRTLLTRDRTRRYAPFVVWAGAFLVAWLTLVLAMDLWDEIVGHWRIALTMLAGSYVAGSTPMGGGTVGFPILVLLFDQPASLGRNFSFLIQSVGMTSAAIYILCSRRPIAARLLVYAMLASLITLPLAAWLLVPLVPGDGVKLVFAVIWGAFGLLTLLRLSSLLHTHHVPRLPGKLDARIGLTVGAIGGVAAALTGVGIDMLLYTVLVLVYRCDLRIAIATSVVVMAFNSLVGTVTAAALGTLDQEVFHNWVAAAPIVLFGAPLGALMVTLIPRVHTMRIVGILCVAQLIWTCVRVKPEPDALVGVALAIGLLMYGFREMDRVGRKLIPDHAHGVVPN